MTNLGDNIKHYRKAASLTQKELGDKINKAEVTIRKYENGQREPKLEIIKEIGNALGVPPSELIKFKGTDSNSRFKITLGIEPGVIESEYNEDVEDLVDLIGHLTYLYDEDKEKYNAIKTILTSWFKESHGGIDKK